MQGIDPALEFLGLVGLISLSGAIMPGPVFARILSLGLEDRFAGAKVTIGHAVIEVPLVIAIFLGFDLVFKDLMLLAAIGIVGGGFLLYMGISMFRIRSAPEKQTSRYGPFGSGIVLTLVNPYFFL